MTAEQISAMEAGTEMDRAVAEAIGGRITRYTDDYDQDAHLLDRGRDGKLQGFAYKEASGLTRHVERFYPSVYWEAAMFAAERAGLFDEAARSLQVWSVGWVVCLELPEGLRLRERIAGCGTTGPLAICRAILALHKR